MFVSLKRLRDEQGYLLVEVLLATIILSVGIITMLRSFDKSIEVARYSRNHARAMCLLEQKLMELRSESLGWPTVRAGESPEWADEFTIDLASVEGEGSVGEIRITIGWREGGRGRSISVNTLVGPHGGWEHGG